MDSSIPTTTAAKRPTWSAGRVVDAEDEAALPPVDAGDVVADGRAGGSDAAADIPSEMPEMERLRTGTRSAPARKRGSTAVSRLMLVGVFVLVGGLAFAIGRTTVSPSGGTQANAAQQGNGFPGGARPDASGAPGGFAGRGAGGGLTVEGTVESVSGGTITVKLSNGETVQVATSSTTAYHGQSSASEADVTAGKTVTIAVDPGSVPAPGASAGTGTTGTTGTTRTASSVTITGN